MTVLTSPHPTSLRTRKRHWPTLHRAVGLLLGCTPACSTDAASEVLFEGMAPGSNYLVAGHRNHLAVMSTVALDCTGGACSHDFRTDFIGQDLLHFFDLPIHNRKVSHGIRSLRNEERTKAGYSPASSMAAQVVAKRTAQKPRLSTSHS